MMITFFNLIEMIVVHGIEYRIELFVVIDSDTESVDGNIIFDCIKEILLINNNQVYLWCEEWHTLNGWKNH